jgi:hypothetical protein
VVSLDAACIHAATLAVLLAVDAAVLTELLAPDDLLRTGLFVEGKVVDFLSVLRRARGRGDRFAVFLLAVVASGDFGSHLTVLIFFDGWRG